MQHRSWTRIMVVVIAAVAWIAPAGADQQKPPPPGHGLMVQVYDADGLLGDRVEVRLVGEGGLTATVEALDDGVDTDFEANDQFYTANVYNFGARNLEVEVRSGEQRWTTRVRLDPADDKPLVMVAVRPRGKLVYMETRPMKKKVTPEGAWEFRWGWGWAEDGPVKPVKVDEAEVKVHQPPVKVEEEPVQVEVERVQVEVEEVKFDEKEVEVKDNVAFKLLKHGSQAPDFGGGGESTGGGPSSGNRVLALLGAIVALAFGLSLAFITALRGRKPRRLALLEEVEDRPTIDPTRVEPGNVVAALDHGPLSGKRVVVVGEKPDARAPVIACLDDGPLPSELTAAVERLAAIPGPPVTLLVTDVDCLDSPGRTEPVTALQQAVGGRFPLWIVDGPEGWGAWTPES